MKFGSTSVIIFLVLVLMVFTDKPSYAHSGRTNSEGCHRDRKHGGYHCHRHGKFLKDFHALMAK